GLRASSVPVLPREHPSRLNQVPGLRLVVPRCGTVTAPNQSLQMTGRSWSFGVQCSAAPHLSCVVRRKRGSAMAELLPEAIDSEVARLFNEGESLLDVDEVDEALARFQTAWEMIPEPKGDWQRALQVLCAIADCWFFLGEDELCVSTLQLAL